MSTAAFARTARSPRLRLLIVGVAAAAALSACGSDDTTDAGATSTAPASGAPTTSQAGGAPTSATDNAPADVTVDVKGMKFSPASIQVKAGDKVTWKFDDGGVPHTVTGLKDAGMGINSPILKEGEYSYTFDKAGTFNYICSIHPEMKGTVTVR